MTGITGAENVMMEFLFATVAKYIIMALLLVIVILLIVIIVLTKQISNLLKNKEDKNDYLNEKN